MARTTLLDDALELAELLKPAWARMSDEIPAWHPRNEGADGGDGSGDADGDGDGDGGDGDGAGSAAGGDDGGAGGEPDWKAESRKHERRAKQERKAREDLERKLQEIEQSSLSEQEQAIAKAREEAKAEALTEAQKERRADRLEVNVTRLAARGITVGDGDDATTVKFADPEDALVHVERAIRNGDVAEDDIFDGEGKVQTDALTTALTEILERKPHLRVAENGNGNGTPRFKGDADAGKGKGGSKNLDDMSVDEHFAAIRKTK